MSESSLTAIETTNRIARADQNPAAIYLASLGSEQSRRTMRNALETIANIISEGRDSAATLQWGVLRFQHTAAIRAALAEKYKHTTANKMLSALRGVLEVSYKLGYISPDDYAKASDIKAIKGGDNTMTGAAGRSLSQGELAALKGVCVADKTAAGARDLALIAIEYSCGLRRAEIVGLNINDYDIETGKLVIRGKGNKARTVYVTNGAQMALNEWLILRGTNTGPLFVRITKGRRITESKLTTQAVYFILQKRGEQAGLKHFSPHDLRRTYAGDMLDRGADIATVAQLMGHASVTTTAKYDRRSEETKKKAANLLYF